MTTGGPTKTVKVTIPLSLYAAISGEATHEDRTFSAQLTRIIRSHYGFSNPNDSLSDFERHEADEMNLLSI